MERRVIISVHPLSVKKELTSDTGREEEEMNEYASPNYWGKKRMILGTRRKGGPIPIL